MDWSDIVFLGIFENGHYAADELYFYESNFKNRQIWPQRGACAAKFSLLKITGTLQKNIFSAEIIPPYWAWSNLLALRQWQRDNLFRAFVYTLYSIYILYSSQQHVFGLYTLSRCSARVMQVLLVIWKTYFLNYIKICICTLYSILKKKNHS